jgi:hypothetical protein
MELRDDFCRACVQVRRKLGSVGFYDVHLCAALRQAARKQIARHAGPRNKYALPGEIEFL